MTQRSGKTVSSITERSIEIPVTSMSLFLKCVDILGYSLIYCFSLSCMLFSFSTFLYHTQLIHSSSTSFSYQILCCPALARYCIPLQTVSSVLFSDIIATLPCRSALYSNILGVPCTPTFLIPIIEVVPILPQVVFDPSGSLTRLFHSKYEKH